MLPGDKKGEGGGKIEDESEILRIKVRLGTDIRKRVIKYAKRKGLRLDRAYGELIEKGLRFSEL